MKKLLSLLLVVCMLMPFAVSCGEKNPPAVTTEPSANPGTPTGPVETTDAITTLYPEIPTDVKYDDYEFVILNCTAGTIDFNDFSIENANYDVVNDAIFKRNSEAESLLAAQREEVLRMLDNGVHITSVAQNIQIHIETRNAAGFHQSGKLLVGEIADMVAYGL